MQIRHHELKIHSEPFICISMGFKKADIRDLKNRNVEVGDTILFREYDDTALIKYSGREIGVVITHIQEGYGLPAHMAVLSFNIIKMEMKL